MTPRTTTRNSSSVERFTDGKLEDAGALTQDDEDYLDDLESEPVDDEDKENVS
jgi:hypothetical protein